MALEKDNTNIPFQLALDFVRYTDENIFLTGKAGSGKTTFLKEVKHVCHKNMVVLAPTGVAATNAGGTTIHSFFQLPLGIFLPDSAGASQHVKHYDVETLLKEIKFPSDKRALLLQIEVIIIDEISMVRADMLDTIDIILRHYRKKELVPFGGVQLVFIGDLFQLPPIVKKEDWDYLKQFYDTPFFFSAHVLQKTPPLNIELRKIYRQTDSSFIELLNNVRDNCCTPSDISLLNTKYTPSLILSEGIIPITLTTHNIKADEINNRQLEILEGKEFIFEALITGDFLEKNYPADKFIRLKAGAQVMLTKNDTGEQRKYFNGKIGKIERLEADIIHIRFSDDTIISLQREKWSNIKYSYNTSSKTIAEEEIGNFKQFPIQLAWAITIHKSQGLTFEKAIIDAGESFAPGQVYVALSRLTALDGLVLSSKISPNVISTDPRILGYTNAGRTDGELRKVLEAVQTTFLFKMVLEDFSFEILADLTQEYISQYPDTASEVPAFGKIKDHAVVAEKFQQRLVSLFNDGIAPDFEKILEKSQAATSFFMVEVDKILTDLQSYSKTLQSQKARKDYILSTNILTEAFQKKKSQLVQGVSIAHGLASREDVKQLHEKLRAKQIKDQIPMQDIPPAIKQRRITGATEEITLQLFKSGLSIEQVAQKRKIALTTVEMHLLKFVQSNELAVHELLPAAKLAAILPLVNGENCDNPAGIKQQLSGSFSYMEIRAAIAHWKRKVISG